MLGEPDIVASIIGATIGALLGSGSSILFGLLVNRRQKKRDTVVELLQEYYSREMIQDRKLTGEFFEHNNAAPKGFYDYWEAFMKSTPPTTEEVGDVSEEEFNAFRRISLFFEKVYLFKDNGYLNRKLAKQMLGNYVCGWARDGMLILIDNSKTEVGQAFHYRKENFKELYKWFQCEKMDIDYPTWPGNSDYD